MRKFIIVASVLCLVFVIYNLDAIFGQWKFNKLCREEGGPRFYSSVEKGEGWEIDGQDKFDYKWPFMFGDIGFVRYQDKQGQLSDVRQKEPVETKKREFVFSPIDPAKSVRYKLHFSEEPLPGDERIYRTKTTVVELGANRVLASYTSFAYQWTKPERTILAAPTGAQCWAENSQAKAFYKSIYNLSRPAE